MVDLDFDALVAQLRALVDALVERAPSEASIAYRVSRWDFERRDDGACVTQQREEDRVYWSHTNVHEWLALLEPYEKVEQLLDESPHVKAWIQQRVTGPDPEKVRKAGLNALIREFALGGCEIGAWRVSDERWQRTVERLRLFLDGRVTHHLLDFLHGVAVTRRLDLDGLPLCQGSCRMTLAA